MPRTESAGASNWSTALHLRHRTRFRFAGDSLPLPRGAPLRFLLGGQFPDVAGDDVDGSPRRRVP